MRRVLAAVLVLSTCGCSVVIEQTDASVDGGGEAGAPDASACSKRMVNSGATSGGCTSTETYTCGADSYEIDCACPGQTCECKKNGAIVGNAQFSTTCPACSTTLDNGGCGFP